MMDTCLPTMLSLGKNVKEAGSGLLIVEVKMCIGASLLSPTCVNLERTSGSNS
jgi:hypothetical protein